VEKILIDRDLLQIYGADPYDRHSVRFWIHEMRHSREDPTDKPKEGRRTFDNINVLAVQQLTRQPFCARQSLTEAIRILGAMANCHFSQSLGIDRRNLQ
jgi:hypothetical protein